MREHVKGKEFSDISLGNADIRKYQYMGTCKSAFHCHDKVPEKNSLKKERFIWAHSFRFFRPWLASSITTSEHWCLRNQFFSTWVIGGYFISKPLQEKNRINGVLVSCGCYNNLLHGLKQNKLILSYFWSPEFWNQNVMRSMLPQENQLISSTSL